MKAGRVWAIGWELVTLLIKKGPIARSQKPVCLCVDLDCRTKLLGERGRKVVRAQMIFLPTPTKSIRKKAGLVGAIGWELVVLRLKI